MGIIMMIDKLNYHNIVEKYNLTYTDYILRNVIQQQIVHALTMNI